MPAFYSKPSFSNGFSLLELIAVTSILGMIGVIALTTVSVTMDNGHQTACRINCAEIEIQCQHWHRAHGSYPNTSLGTISADVNYFPEGLPTCPVDGSAYTIDTATGLVNSHNH